MDDPTSCSRELAFALAMLVFGLTALWQAWRISGFVLVERARRDADDRHGHDELFGAGVPAQHAAHAKARRSPRTAAGAPVLHRVLPLPSCLFTALIVVYMFALEPLGFVVSSFAFLVASMFTLGSRRIVFTLVVSAAVAGRDLPGVPDRVFRRAAGRRVAGSAQMTEALSFFFMSWTDPYLLFLTAAGTFAGIYVGAIPGLSVTMAVSILISFTFKWNVNEALALIAGIYPRRRLRRLAQRHPAQHSRRAGGDRHRASTATRWPSAAMAGEAIGAHHRRIGARRLHRHHRPGRWRARAVQARAAVRAARLPAAGDLGHPAGRQPVRQVARQGRVRRRRSACWSAWSASTR